MKTYLVTAPEGFPVLIDEVKRHLNVDHDEDDAYILGLIASATAQAEDITRRRLVTQTWKAFADAWPSDAFVLPFGRLQSVTEVTYTDTAGTETTLAASAYIVDAYSDPGRVVLGYNQTWPTTELYPSNPIAIEYVCGYGDEPDVPGPIKAAIMLMVGDLYAHRESIFIGTIGTSMIQIPGHVMNLLWPYRLWGE